MSEPSGPLGLAMRYLRDAIADSTSFRALVGASGDDAQAAARSRVHFEALPAPAGEEYTRSEWRAMRPYALLWAARQSGFTRTRDATYAWADSGRIHCELVWEVPETIAHDYAEVDSRFLTIVGDLIDDVTTLAEQAGYLDFTEVAVVEGPYRTGVDELETMGDAMGVELVWQWQGPGGEA